MLKTKVLLIPQDPKWGRDQNKALLITEMPAVRAEKWAMRMFLALKGSSSQIPTELQNMGMIGVAIVTLNVILRSDVSFDALEPLLDEMLTCVQAIPDHNNASHARPLLPGEIQEVATLALLRSEILELHTGFSVADALSELISKILTATDSLNTSTSPR